MMQEYLNVNLCSGLKPRIEVKEETYQNIKNSIYNFCIFMIPSIKIIAIYFVYILIHYLSPYAYIYFCVPQNMLGFIISPIMNSTLQCKAIRWIMIHTSLRIEEMWKLIGLWFIHKLV